MSLYKKGFYIQLDKFLEMVKTDVKKLNIKNYKTKSNKLKLSIIGIKALNTINSKYIIENFYEKINEKHENITIKDKIMNNHVDFFLTDEFKKIMEKNLKDVNTSIFSINDIFDIEDIWIVLNDKQKETFTKNLKMLVILSDRYMINK